MEPDSTKDSTYRVVLLGATGVGKSSILVRAILNMFYPYQESTIGAAYNKKEVVDPKTGRKVTLSIWDTAGQERYRSLAPMYYRGAHVALVVFDITREDSLSRAQFWVEELKRSSSLDTLQIVMIGNKVDLESDRQVTPPMEYCENHNCKYFETSAKTGQGVDELFTEIASHLPTDDDMDNLSNDEGDDELRIDISKPPTTRNRNKGKGCACG